MQLRKGQNTIAQQRPRSSADLRTNLVARVDTPSTCRMKNKRVVESLATFRRPRTRTQNTTSSLSPASNPNFCPARDPRAHAHPRASHSHHSRTGIRFNELSDSTATFYSRVDSFSANALERPAEPHPARSFKSPIDDALARRILLFVQFTNTLIRVHFFACGKKEKEREEGKRQGNGRRKERTRHRRGSARRSDFQLIAVD